MKPRLIMHCNYCEQGQTLEEMCVKAVDWGFDGVEFRRKRSGVKESCEHYLDQLAEATSRSGLETILFGGPGPDLMKSDEAAREKELEEIRLFFLHATERFELTVCNTMSGALKNPAPGVPYGNYGLHGSAIATEHHWSWAYRGFGSLAHLAEELGFRLAFETHMCYLHDTPAMARRLVDAVASPALGVNLDYGNAVYFGENLSLRETIDMLGDMLFYVHFKNSVAVPGAGRVPTGLGEGDINHREYLRLLKEANYEGPICLEAPRQGDREWYVQRDVEYVESLLTDIGWS